MSVRGGPGEGATARGPIDDPWIAYLIRSVRGGVAASILLLVVLTVYLVLPGSTHVERGALAGAIVAGTVVTLVAAALPWNRLVGHPRVLLLLYAWSIVMIGLIDTGIAFTGGATSELYVLLVVLTAFMTGPLYPVAAQVALDGLAVVGYVLTLAGTGWAIRPADLVYRVGMMVTAAFAVGVLSNELGRSLDLQTSERRASDRRVALWSRMAAVARQIDAPDVDRVLEAVVDALGALEFDASDVCAIEDGGAYRVLCARNLADAYTSARHATADGIVGMVVDRRRTVVVDDYGSLPGAIPALRAEGFQTVIAGPVWTHGDLAAVLEAGTHRRRTLLPEEIAAFEMLAAQTGRALENAQLLEHRRSDAERLRNLLESSPDAVVVVDTSSGLIVEISNQAERLLGYGSGELLGRKASILVPERVQDEQFSMVDQWLAGVGDAVVGLDRNVYVLRKDGVELPVEATFSTLDTHHGSVISIALRDVSERREFERRLVHQATHDRLTGLPNRELFMQHLGGSIHGRLTVDPPVAVFLLDVDHFKYLNESRGHRAGDSLVVAVAERLGEVAAGQFIARVGGDEFAMLVEGAADQFEASAFAERLLACFEQPFPVGGVDCYVSASIGVAFGDAHGEADVVMRNADAAVNQAKQNGRGRIEFFDESLTLLAAERIATEAELHLALDRGDFRLAYQPVVSLDSARMVGMEALLRWHHPERGVVSPAKFIPIAEDSGLITPIGRWVLGEACRQLADWRRRLPGLPDISVSVNVSNRQLDHDRFVGEVAEVLTDTGVPPDLLVLEITESLFIRDFHATVRRLHALKELGVRLAIDDFGTGFSSLFSLSRLPVDIVKIDKAFVDGLGSRHDAVVAAVVMLGDAFGLQVVAEGIEHPEQRDRLIELGCRFAQGFHFSKPLDVPATESLLEPLRAGEGNPVDPAAVS